jgi:DNA polymerase-3 subunit epsilon
VAIDFETADHGRDSACAVALVRVEGGRIVQREERLICPPRREFVFTYIHGITWQRVAREPRFGEVWRELAPVLAGAEFFAAHNAAFDRGVLAACCEAAGLPPPALPFECTVQLARRAWNIRPTRLPNVCAHLGIDLRHHDAVSDAEACARIVIAAQEARVPLAVHGGARPRARRVRALG